MPPRFDPGPNPYGPPPICLGALGPVMTRTAAEVADGLLVMPFKSVRHYRERTLPAIEEGLDRAGRHAADLAIYPQVIVGTGRTPDELAAASRGVRRPARLLRIHARLPPVLDVEGWGDLQPELNALSKVGEYAAMAELIDDKMLKTLAVHGTPEECAAEIVDRFGAYSDRVCCYFRATRFGTGTSPISSRRCGS